MRTREMTMGSLFSGSGSFELASVINGITPKWNSEIEPFCLRVEKLRFPDVKQLGSVTEVNGAEIEPVDIITFGSPCQDLSVAGKQAGIREGARSSLFFEAVRIIREMREQDIANGRTGKHIRPRFAVWENVPGAFSSNKGKDFQAVLQALCEIRGGADHIVPLPPKNKWLPAGCVVGDGFSIAWRVYDAQYWPGTPQRRKRIYLIADFGSERAGEILFKSESERGDSSESGKAREGTSADAQGSAGRSDRVECLNPWDCQSKRQYSVDGVYRTLDAGEGSGGQAHGVCYAPAAFMGGQGAKARSIAYCDDGSTPTLKSVPSGGNTVPDVVYAVEGNGTRESHRGDGYAKADAMYTLNATEHHKVAYAIEGNSVDRNTEKNGKGFCEGVSPTLNTQDKHAVCYGIDCRNGCLDNEKTHTIQAKPGGGFSQNCTPSVLYRQDGYAGYCEGCGTLKESGGDSGGV